MGTIGDLREIAKRMVAARYEKKCSHRYSTCRREFLEESLSRMGFQKPSIDEEHTPSHLSSARTTPPYATPHPRSVRDFAA
ncbi:exocyst complex component EXO70B1 [Olea europaea subsp. europaea]|uniref:Exocyst complex component EXO70B1 n=1 Tax=Olea europaea subsp. europaea TaxID=158383 RepID=A0A8S0QSV5_OLEEU|nr:exocyst complex component EXO70B1 [Olea europaea subsp. europaea]